MSLKKKIAKNFFSLLFSTVTAKLLTFIIVIVIARYLGKENFGIYAAAQAYVGIFVILFGAGMESGFIYTSTKDKTTIPWFLGSGILLKVLMSIFAFIVIILLAKMLGYSSIHINLIIIFAFTWLFISFQSFLSGVYQIHQRMEYKAVLDSGRELLFLIFVLLIFKLDLGLYGAAGSKLLANLIFLLIAWIFALKFARPDFSRIKFKSVIKSSYLFAFAGLFYMIYFQIDTVMLSLMRNATETGLYAAAYKLPIAAFIISHALSVATRPAMFEHANNEKDRLKNIYFLRAKYLMILGLFIGISVWFLRNQIVSLAFGSDFARSAIVLGILAWFIPIRFVSVVSGDVVTTVGKQSIRTVIQGATAVVNVVINLILIPRYGLFGAAWATLCSEIFLLGSYTFFASRLFVRLPTLETYIKPIVAGILMCFILLFSKTHWLLSFAISSAIFWTSLVLFGIFKKDPLLSNIRTKLLRI